MCETWWMCWSEEGDSKVFKKFCLHELGWLSLGNVKSYCIKGFL